MRLLIEEPLFDDQKMVSEKSEDGVIKRLFIHGPFSLSETKNNNGRIYPDTILSREIERFQPLIESGQAIGELDHPDSPKINLKNVSHKIVDLKKEGKNLFIGKAQILDTDSGKQAKSLAEAGVKLGISSRALGSLTNEDKGKIVNDDLHLVTYDIVARPSFSQALMNAIYEAREWNLVGDDYVKTAADPRLSESEREALIAEVKKWRNRYYSVRLQNLLIEGLEQGGQSENG